MSSQPPGVPSWESDCRTSGPQSCLSSPSSQFQQSTLSFRHSAVDPVSSHANNMTTDRSGSERHSTSPTLMRAGCSKDQSLSETTEQKKHRRTRSGCFTCRSRRVKVCRPRQILMGFDFPLTAVPSVMREGQYVNVSSVNISAKSQRLQHLWERTKRSRDPLINLTHLPTYHIPSFAFKEVLY